METKSPRAFSGKFLGDAMLSNARKNFNFYKQGEYVYFNFTMQSLKLTKKISVENCEVQ